MSRDFSVHELKPGQFVRVGTVKVFIQRVIGGRIARIAIDAPKEIKVMRKELLKKE